MMDRHERSALTAALSNVVRDYVSKAEEKFRKWANDELKALTDLFEERLKAIPEPRQGDRGEKGDPGAKGDKGERGEPGESIQGVKGDKGDQGERGEKGDKGDIGYPGTSIKGDKGDSGERGEPGPIGPRGEIGEKGIDGTNGRNGIDGKDGAPGIPGLPGDRGEKGLDGKDGKDGRDGRDGKDGINGRDALQIDILPTIDLSKEYPRGTFATFRGGFLWAARNTTAGSVLENSGWCVIVNGFFSHEYEQSDDYREIVCRDVMTNGEVIERRFYRPSMIQVGVYHVGTEYLRGQCVVYRGSTWHCTAESTKAIPGESKDWLQIAQRGKDGKDFRPEEPKPAKVLSLK